MEKFFFNIQDLSTAIRYVRDDSTLTMDENNKVKIMFDTFTNQITQLILTSKEYWPFCFYILAILWSIQCINFILGYRLNYLGIIPRHLLGLPGIIFSPLLHADFEHLLFNSIPLFILSNLLLIQHGLYGFIFLTVFIMLFSGLGIWLIGRSAIHIGASAVIMGYWSCLLTQVYFYPNVSAILVGLVCLYYLGSMWINIFPSARKQVSWEGHLIGFLAGIFYAIIIK